MAGDPPGSILRGVSTSKNTAVKRPVQAPMPRQGQAGRDGGGVSNRTLTIAAIGSALVIAAVAIGASLLSAHSSKAKPAAASEPTQIVGAAATAAMLKGIPQHGTTLGSPDAPVTLVEYADLQCPYCGEFARTVLPALVAGYVRPGKVKIEFRGLEFVGPDSGTALRTALGATAQNRVWNVVDLLYRNQGTENTGWVTDAVLNATLAAVPGLDAAQVVAASGSDTVAKQMENASSQATAAGVKGTPSFEVGRTGTALQPLPLTALDIATFQKPLNTLLQG